ncbi:unnamed protein product [Rotaria sp. Silwood1]|nr:unnamed protein product [Rotaria sp. Silwood1]CAF1388425.1 unnamed protein product [Rotaria sp. Silwood1]CAF4896882.1 unnamed protein product [Rotaria sp. Silwood1]
MSLLPLNKDDNKQITKQKPHSAPSNIQTTITSENETSTTKDDSMLTKISIKQDDSEEKPQKLFVVVSDVDSTCTPSMSNETTNSNLLSVDDCEINETIKTLPLRQRSSTCSGQHLLRYREQYSRKTIEERLRRRSWMVSQTNNNNNNNNNQTSDNILQNQQTMNLLRSRRFRLGQSEPNLTSLQMDLSYPLSPTTKTSPRTSSVTPTITNTLQLLSRRPSIRRPNLSGLNLINLKHALRKQLSPQQTLCAITNDSNQDSNILDNDIDRRWSLTSAPSSSGYGTTSPPSSQYSSFERLQHQQQQQQHICTCKRQQIDSNLYDDLQRLESRSISMSLLDANLSTSSNKMMIIPEQDLNTMAFIYKERYPKAKIQMEERLQNFIDTYKLIDKFDHCSDGSARFIHNQIVELAKDCLDKSNKDLITTLYFNEMTVNLERLLLNAKEKCPQTIENLQTIVRKLLLIIARSARLLECLHFNPEDFLRTLEEVECQAKTMTHIKQDIPKYICSKLNLDRNPLDVIDALQFTELTNSEAENFKALSLSESENESITDTNYLTITPNTTFSPIERSTSIKGPCEEDFEIIKLISNGAYGAVHLVKHRQTQERYAMKKVSKTNLILRNQIEQVFVERDIMTFTDNPFVVALICTFETKNHLCLVMEYVEGGDVATLLKNIGGPLNIDIARMYFAETTLAVEYLHSYGIIHRDLKPDNLLITSIGHIKLTDFGLSKIGLMSLTTNFYEKLLDKETKIFNDKQICGTPSYIAPEVILRQGYGKPVDWWSMGIILYEFLVGIPPFTGNTPDELFVNVINGKIDWDQLTCDIDENTTDGVICRDAKNLIEQLLEHDPSKRLGTLGGAYEIRSHPFCSSINWNTLLREKADFVPVLESPDDTSYFDTRQDRYKHSDDDDDNLSTTTTNDSDSLFASFSSVSLKYVSELSGNSKQRHSPKQENDSKLVKNVLRANSCTDSFSSNNIIQIDSTNDFQPLVMSKSMSNEQAESPTIQASFGSDTFEPLHVSSDESESSSKKLNSSSSSLSSSLKITNTDEKKSPSTLTKHYKQRKSSLKIFEKQNSIDSGDDNQQEKTSYRHHKKSRIPRALSPIQSKQTNLITPIVSISHENVQNSSSSYKPIKYNSQQQKCTFSRTVSKSFSSSSSSSPPPILYYNQDDRSYRQNQRHRMTVSPLERDTTLKVEKQSSKISLIHSITNTLRPPIIIRRGPRSFGFTLRAVKVFHGNTDYYTTQHVVVAVQGPAEEAGLKPNDVITHVNEHPVSGLCHSEVVKLILSGSEKLSIRAVPCSETQIRIGGRRRSPSKQKNRYQQQTEKKISTINNDNHYHQPYCSKHRMNSLGNNTLTNSNKKHQHNTSLFRRLSERKVARDIEAAAAAAAANVSLIVPTTCINTNTNNTLTTTTNTDILSSSLPLLSFNQLMHDNNNNERSSSSSHHKHNPSKWSPSKSSTLLTKDLNASQSTSLPSITKQKSPPRQNHFHAPMISSHRKKLQRQNSIYVPPSPTSLQSTFTWENNLNQNMQSYYNDPLTHSLSTESSTSSTSTSNNVDSHSSNPIFVSTKYFYRRK